MTVISKSNQMYTLTKSFHEEIKEGIPSELPDIKPYDINYNHAPKRKLILNKKEQKLALKNALRYFEKKFCV